MIVGNPTTQPDLLEQLDPKALGEELFEARKKAALTQADAAELLGVARTTITAIEAGERRIRPSELIKLATAYGRPFTSFIRPRPPIAAVAPQFRASFRIRPEWENELETAIASLEDMLKDYLELYQIAGLQPSLRYIPEYPISGLSVDTAAESVAVAERNRLGLGDGPVAQLRDVLEQEAGISVFMLKLPDWCSGMYLYSVQLGAIVAVNCNHPSERQRNTLSHEWMHFLTNRHAAEITDESPRGRLSFEERVAGEFPNHFLMPAVGIRRRVASLKQSTGTLSARGLIDLAAYYGVSVEALLRWLEDLKLLPSGTFDEAKRRGFPIRQIQKEAGIISPAERQDLLPLRFQQLAFQALQEGKIPEGRFAEVLRIDRPEARRITRVLRPDQEAAAPSTSMVAE